MYYDQCILRPLAFLFICRFLQMEMQATSSTFKPEDRGACSGISVKPQKDVVRFSLNNKGKTAVASTSNVLDKKDDGIFSENVFYGKKRRYVEDEEYANRFVGKLF